MQDVLPMENIVFRRSVKEDIPYINSLFIEMIKTVNARMRKEGIFVILMC